MSSVFLIARREWGAYIRSPIAMVVIAAFLLIEGILFNHFALTEKLLTAEALSEFFNKASGMTLIVGIVLTIRLVAEERSTGTLTLLTTSPAKDWQIIFGKYLAAFAMILLVTALSVYMPLLLLVNGKISWGHLLVGYAGLLLLGSATAAVGIFASSLTKSQVVAAVVGAAILVVLLLMWMIARATEPPINGFLSALALHHENFKPFQSGILKLQPVVYYVVVTYCFLLAATKVLEARRWR